MAELLLAENAVCILPTNLPSCRNALPWYLPFILITNMLQGSTTTASTLPADVGAESCSDQESEATGVTNERVKTTEITA